MQGIMQKASGILSFLYRLRITGLPQLHRLPRPKCPHYPFQQIKVTLAKTEAGGPHQINSCQDALSLVMASMGITRNVYLGEQAAVGRLFMGRPAGKRPAAGLADRTRGFNVQIVNEGGRPTIEKNRGV